MKSSCRVLSLLWPLSVCAQTIYLYPSHPSLQPKFSLQQANAVLSHHLRLDEFETSSDPLVAQYIEKSTEKGLNFVASGRDDALIVNVLSESSSPEFIPDEFSNPIEVSLVSTAAHQFSFASTLSRCERHASLLFASSRTPSSPATPNFLDPLHLSSTPEVAVFMNELSSMIEFLDTRTNSNSFGSFEFATLDVIRSTFGGESAEYTTAIKGLRAALQGAASSSHLRLAVFISPTTSMSHHMKRQPPQQPLPLPPQEPFFSSSTCFGSFNACTNSTNSCSGHGACTNATRVTAGKEKTCFVCACSPTTDSRTGSKQVWVGSACERKDISTEFTLLAGTSVALILLVVGSISLLYSIGTQELPNTLTAIPSTSSRRD